jgi:ParB family chromosome partitioning protein
MLTNNNQCEYIPIHKIKTDSSHIRKKPGDISHLKCTVSDVGLLQPILVRKSNDSYVIIDGERRLRAMKELAISELIVGREIIVDVDETEADARFKQIIANIQHEDINHFDLGHAFVTLKEKYGYQYREIAEIIGKTPHYVTSKVGLAKRLIGEVQEMAAIDWEESKCIQGTFSGEDDDIEAYEMNIKIIEDIARLPEEFQKTAYITIRTNEMSNDDALKYLRSIKKQGRVPVKVSSDSSLQKYFEKIDRDIEKLADRLKMADRMSRSDLLLKLESSLDKLNLLYARLKSESGSTEQNERTGAFV